MRFRVAAVVMAAASAAFHFSVRASQELTAQTKGSGIYTDAQAKRGETIYAKACESCHAKDLSGADQAPSLVGKDFHTEWTDQSVGDLFERIRVSMPADAPGTLKPEDVADVMAFMLNKGGFPAGPVELPTKLEALNTIKFPSAKPQD